MYHFTLLHACNNRSSGFVVRLPASNTAVVAMATGTKCLGASARSPEGLLVNDCHAEVLARRALRLWLLAEAQAALADTTQQQQQQQDTSKPSASRGSLVLTADAVKRTASLRQGVTLHLVVTQAPCGDACVVAGLPTGAKRVRYEDGSWKLPQAGDVESSPEPGLMRRKPGKGDPTLSMSCSDKLLKWACMGLQARLVKMRTMCVHVCICSRGRF